MNDNILGKRIKLLRTESQLTQEEFGAKYNLKKSTISQYESGTSRPDDELKAKIAKDYNVTIDWLLGLTDIRNLETKQNLPIEFNTPEEAMKFILEQNVIMGFGGFDVEKMSNEEIVEFANELLRQLKLLSYKYKK